MPQQCSDRFIMIYRFSFEDGIDKDELSKIMKGCNLRWQQLPMIFRTFWGHNCLWTYHVSDHSWKSTEAVQKHGGWLWDLGWKPFRVETINDENLFWYIFKFWQIILSHKHVFFLWHPVNRKALWQAFCFHHCRKGMILISSFQQKRIGGVLRGNQGETFSTWWTSHLAHWPVMQDSVHQWHNHLGTTIFIQQTSGETGLLVETLPSLRFEAVEAVAYEISFVIQVLQDPTNQPGTQPRPRRT